MSKASENLATEQEQCDPDGVMVIVSRQAVDETLSQYSGMLDALKLCAEYLGELPPGGTREPLYVAYSAATDAIAKATGAE